MGQITSVRLKYKPHNNKQNKMKLYVPDNK